MNKCRLDNSPIVYYVADNNHKEWVLFLHAAFVNHNMFNSQAEFFKSNYNVIVPEIIGHGESTNTKKGDSIEKMSQWIYEILEKHNIERIHIVGVSIGAVLAQDFANKYPHRVKSLSCFGGYDINNFDLKMQKENGAAQMFMMLKAFVSVKWFAEANKKISAYTEKARDDFYEMNIQFPKKSFMFLAGLNKMVNVCKTQPRKYPLLIGCGEHDIPMEHTAVKMWDDTEQGASLVIFEGAGHCVNMDVPDLFNETLDNFFKNGKV